MATAHVHGHVEPKEVWISTGDAARLLQVGSINTVKRWAREGKLTSRHLGHRTQIEKGSVERLLQATDPNVTKMQRLEVLLAELQDLGGT